MQGYSTAMRHLANIYEDGFGVKKDNKLAYMWAYLSSEEPESKEMIAQMEKLLSDSEIEEAKALVLECKDSSFQDCQYIN
ncbi:SEL1-like repeat protein [Enterovibrio nigricans]|uniref:Sel1 repeat-containing protein n=1 Tax=Enterovibrio nigricans DSM 22720 TaxID=1121868 RepID=A0A1T4U540_9GAMM|nr:SEL1-like repeat protein [Enterovibrio nigricans]PKF50531.1 hypothetical protein AT251_10675 [Enterovibrio nigricans]SKA47720.1 hypothetical protein SAMN02745132_00747 [Enterovibrio nigricans DSM 22720]